MITIDASTPAELKNFAPVGRYSTLEKAREHMLVILAKNSSCWLQPGGVPGPEEPGAATEPGAAYTLYAEPERIAFILRDLAAYEREQAQRRDHVEAEPPRFPSGAWMAFLWVLALLTVFLFQRHDPSITERGASSSLALIDGAQWWRPFTALFLHADLAHLAGNVAMGVVFSLLVARSIGPLLGWILILASGATGNILTSLVYYPEPFRSLGASTAVFGALGILTGFGFYLACRAPSHTPWASVLLPIGGGIALLAWFGSGGPTTDILGHLSGFAVGAVFGLAAAWWRMRAPLQEAVARNDSGSRPAHGTLEKPNVA